MSLEYLVEIDINRGFSSRDLPTHFRDDLVYGTAALILQFDGYVSGVRFGHRRQAQLQPRTARGALHFGQGPHDLLHVRNHAVSLLERAARWRDVVENEAALIHRRKQVAAQRLVAKVRDNNQNRA